MRMNKVSVVLLAGGIGKRMKQSVPKQFLLLAGKPIIVHVLEKLNSIPEIDEIIIPTPEKFHKQMIELFFDYNFSKDIKCIIGGKDRQESTYKALKEVKHDIVIVHEAVRPFVRKEEFQALIDSDYKNAIFATDIPFTVLEGGTIIEKKSG